MWAALVLGGMVALARYSVRPGTTATAATSRSPSDWPARSSLSRAQRWTLVVALHPGCPCSRATVVELGKILAATNASLDVDVLVWRPAPGVAGDSPDEGWIRSGLSGLPGVVIVSDVGGAEARRFGAEVSGHAVLFDPSGLRRFAGGITASRGHEGDNDGEETVIGLVRGQLRPDPRTATPVFGCSLGRAGEDLRPGGPPQ